MHSSLWEVPSATDKGFRLKILLMLQEIKEEGAP